MVSLRRSELIEIFNVTIVKPSVSSGYLHYKVPRDITLSSCKIQIFEKSGVSSGTLSINIKQSPTQDDLGMSTIFATAPSINFSTASDYAESSGSFSTPNISAGSYLRLDISSIPSGWTGAFQILFNAK
jgi:hypothetical protein